MNSCHAKNGWGKHEAAASNLNEDKLNAEIVVEIHGWLAMVTH